MKKKILSFFLCTMLLLMAGTVTSCQGKVDNAKKTKEKQEQDGEARQIASKFLKKLRIRKKPLETERMDIPHVFSPGMSYLAVLAGVLGAYDSELSTIKVTFYSGPIYETRQENRNGKKETVTAPARPATILRQTLDNLGYRAYIGYNKRGFKRLEDYLVDGESGTHQAFKNGTEAFDFLKRIVSSAIPVIALVDKKFIDGKSGGDFVVVTGYDKENVYLDYPAVPNGKDLSVKNADFLKAWSSGAVAKTPNLMIFVEQVRGARPEVEILAKIKKECKSIASYLNKDADDLEKGRLSVKDLEFFGDLGSAKRSALAVFLEISNFKNASGKYDQIAKLYEEIGPELSKKEIIKKLRKIAKEEKQAAANWR